MKKMLLSTLFFALTLTSIWSQTARVQVIHNCPDAAASEVDVYLGNELLLDNFAFRTATPFIDAPANEEISIGIALSNSMSSDDVLAWFDYTLMENETYVIAANGIVVPGGYNPAPAFNLDVFAGAKENSTAGNTDVLVLHGSTDAPMVDVREPFLDVTLVDDIMYPEFAGYLTLPTADYTLDITDATGTLVVRSYQAPLAALGLDGAALVALASGFLDPANNNDGAAFGIYVALPTGGDLIALPTTMARAQVIHNSPDAAAAVVDVYITAPFSESIKLDDFAFRTATPFVDLPAHVNLEVAIAPSNSMSAGEAIATFNYNLAKDEKYIIAANGIVVPDGYNPAPAFNLDVFAGAKENSSAGNTDVLVLHGSTDAPSVDVREPFLDVTLVDDIMYPEFAGYLELPTADYTLDITDASGTVVVRSYQAPLAALGLDGVALVAVASGFLDPANNNDGAAFGAYVALPTGGDLIALPGTMARAQVIHNSADAAAEVVDVYLDGSLLLDNFEFRTASPFVDLPARQEITVSIAPENSNDVSESIADFSYNLEKDETYVIVANGIVSTTGYDPEIPFDLHVYAGAREEAAMMNNTDVLVFHGSTDAPTVDVREPMLNVTLVDNLAYADFDGYLELDTQDYVLDVTDESGNTVVASYSAPLETLNLDGAAITVLASGFLNPANNSNGESFGLWVALANGGDLVELPMYVGVVEKNDIEDMTIFPNPAQSVLNIKGVNNSNDVVQLTIFESTGRQVWSQQVTGNQLNTVLDISDLASGVYNLMATTVSGSQYTRFNVIK